MAIFRGSFSPGAPVFCPLLFLYARSYQQLIIKDWISKTKHGFHCLVWCKSSKIWIDSDKWLLAAPTDYLTTVIIVTRIFFPAFAPTFYNCALTISRSLDKLIKCHMNTDEIYQSQGCPGLLFISCTTSMIISFRKLPLVYHFHTYPFFPQYFTCYNRRDIPWPSIQFLTLLIDNTAGTWMDYYFGFTIFSKCTKLLLPVKIITGCISHPFSGVNFRFPRSFR